MGYSGGYCLCHHSDYGVSDTDKASSAIGSLANLSGVAVMGETYIRAIYEAGLCEFAFEDEYTNEEIAQLLVRSFRASMALSTAKGRKHGWSYPRGMRRVLFDTFLDYINSIRHDNE
jgi:hypothetical protein